MPPLLRPRRATAAVAALFAGAVPLATVVIADPVPAVGAPARDGGHEVVFDGDGLLGLRCAARPEAVSVTVPAETTVRVVNRSDRRARLMLDKVARAELASGASADVLFHHGPVSVGLRPICVFAAESAVRVEVGPPRDRAPGGDPWASPAGCPQEAEATGAPDRGSPGFAWESGLAAEPLGPVDPVRDDGPTGLLALIAAVCVVGVSAGAIRAIIAHRVTRTLVA